MFASKLLRSRSFSVKICVLRPLLAAGALATICGCGDESEPRVTVAPVTGTVTFRDEPAAGAQVVLHPRGHALPDGTAATGVVQADGRFGASIYSDGEGVPPGDYVVTVQWFKVVDSPGGAGRGPNVLPKQYADPDATPLKVSVAAGSPTDIEPIVIR